MLYVFIFAILLWHDYSNYKRAETLQGDLKLILTELMKLKEGAE
jgi:hypothetical protein